MDSEPNSENQQVPVAEKPSGEQSIVEQPPADPSALNKPEPLRPPGPGLRDNRRGRGGRGRSRFKRDNRDNRDNRGDGGDRPNREGDRGDHGDRGQAPRPPVRERADLPFRQPSGTMARAIEQVDHIKMELSQVLEEMEEVLMTLDQVEREKNAAEAEVEKLRDALRSLHRGPSYPRNPRSDPPFRAPAPPETHESGDADPESSPPPGDDASDTGSSAS